MADPVARIIHMKTTGAFGAAPHFAVSGGRFHPLVPNAASGPGETIAVGAVILRAADHYKSFRVARINDTVEIGDVIRTAPDTVMALEFLIGGRVGINTGSCIRIITERSVADDETVFSRIVMRKGGIWTKASRLKEPLEIQTNGGVMGIKG